MLVETSDPTINQKEMNFIEKPWITCWKKAGLIIVTVPRKKLTSTGKKQRPVGNQAFTPAVAAISLKKRLKNLRRKDANRLSG